MAKSASATRILLALGIAIAFAVAWQTNRQVSLLVIGQPTTTGSLQKFKEEPFFENLAASTQLPVKVEYKPLNSVGFKDSYQLQMLRDGLFDLVSLRFIQNSDTEPALQGIDMVGFYSDYETARAVAKSYSATVDRYFSEKFGAKLLGVWTFGPQVLFCRQPLRKIEDIRGMKVRVASGSMAALIASLGGTPAIIPFDDTKAALAIGLVDCAITSAASANYAGWLQHTRYLFPLAIHFGLNGYAISLKKWNAFSASEQVVLTKAFDAFLDDLWAYSEATHLDATRCSVGGECRHGVPYNLTLVEPSAHDEQILRETATNTLLPEWFANCERVHPGCRDEWMQKVAFHLH